MLGSNVLDIVEANIPGGVHWAARIWAITSVGSCGRRRRAAGQPCGADYTTEAVESSLAVVVIVTAHPNGAAGACDAVGAHRTASVTLASPLGERTLLEAAWDVPLPSG